MDLALVPIVEISSEDASVLLVYDIPGLSTEAKRIFGKIYEEVAAESESARKKHLSSGSKLNAPKMYKFVADTKELSLSLKKTYPAWLFVRS